MQGVHQKILPYSAPLKSCVYPETPEKSNWDKWVSGQFFYYIFRPHAHIDAEI